MEIDHVFASGAVVGRTTMHSWGHPAVCSATSDPTCAWWRVHPRLLMKKHGRFLQPITWCDAWWNTIWQWKPSSTSTSRLNWLSPLGHPLKILFTQYTCASLWWQLVLNTANLWMQLTLKAAVATHVLDVFTGWFTPSTGLARVLRIICQKSHNLVRLSDEYILYCDLDYENFDLDPERVIKYNTRGPFYHHGLTLISAWISHHMPRKVWAEITYPFPNFNGCTV